MFWNRAKRVKSQSEIPTKIESSPGGDTSANNRSTYTEIPESDEQAVRASVVSNLIDLGWQVAPRLVAIHRSEFAAEGRAFTLSGEEVFCSDVEAVIRDFARATGEMTVLLGNLFLDIVAGKTKKRPYAYLDVEMHTLAERVGRSERRQFWKELSEQNAQVYRQRPDWNLPGCIATLAASPNAQDQLLSRDLAKAFLDLTRYAKTLSARFREANDFVSKQYESVLSPYLCEQSLPQDVSTISLADFLNSIESGDAFRCDTCLSSLAILDLDQVAGPESVKAAYRDMAKIWHPDRFADGDLRLKAKAEEKFKSIQAAYLHLCDHLRGASDEPTLSDLSLDDVISLAQRVLDKANKRMVFIVNTLANHLKGDSRQIESELSVAIDKVLLAHVEAMSIIQSLLPRLTSEAPFYPVEDLQSALVSLSQLSQMLIEEATKAGVMNR